MKRLLSLWGLLIATAFPLYAQNWTPQDSIRLQQLLNGKGELELNQKALKELHQERLVGTPEVSLDKPWMDFDTSLPDMPETDKRKNKVRLTLYPYRPNTPYNWDPVYQRKIKVDKNTWRGPFYELRTRSIPSNWAKCPLDAGPRESVEQIEATGLRYRVTERANGMAVGSWQSVNSIGGGQDLMKPFTRDFWDIKGRKRRARTLEVLRTYGDSISVWEKDATRLNSTSIHPINSGQK